MLRGGSIELLIILGKNGTHTDMDPQKTNKLQNKG